MLDSRGSTSGPYDRLGLELPYTDGDARATRREAIPLAMLEETPFAQEALTAHRRNCGCAACHEAAEPSEYEALDDQLDEAQGWKGTPEEVAFRGRVLAQHIARSSARSGAALPNLDEDSLSEIAGTGIRTVPATARAAEHLLAAAEADLARAKASGDPDANRTTKLTIYSGYRGSAKQRTLWESYFTGYFNQTRAAREALPTGPLSDAAVKYLLAAHSAGGFGIPERIAAPGYSNHQSGRAVDFGQERARGHGVRNSSHSADRARWRATWFHKWLRQHAVEYGFTPLASEEWHWEYSATATRAATPVQPREQAVPAARSEGVSWTWSRPGAPPVALYVSSAARGRADVEIVFFVHGLLKVCKPIPSRLPGDLLAAAPFALARSVESSGRPIVLVVPLFQPGGNDTWSARGLGNPKALNALLGSVPAEVALHLGGQAPTISKLVVAGHSRAFGVLYPLASAHASPEFDSGALARLSDLWLLDATYGTPPRNDLAALAAARPGLSIVVVFRRPSDTDKFVAGGIKGVRLQPLSARAVSHCGVPAHVLPGLLGTAASTHEAEEMDYEDYVDPLAEAELAAALREEEGERYSEEASGLDEAEYEVAGSRHRRAAPSRPAHHGPSVADKIHAGTVALTQAGLTTAEAKAVLITSTLETGVPGGFAGLTGNFDGQGLSFGLVNWTIGTGSLQPLLRAFAQENPDRWNAVFGSDAARLRTVIAGRSAKDIRAQWGFAVDEMNAKSQTANGKVHWAIRQPWRGYFEALASEPAFRAIEIRAIRPLLTRAKQYCDEFGLTSERALAFMFDAVSSNGKGWLDKTINHVKRKRRTLLDARLAALRAGSGGRVSEDQLLLAIAAVLGGTVLPKWAAKVERRKRWFVTGVAPRSPDELAALAPNPAVPFTVSTPPAAAPLREAEAELESEGEELAWLDLESGAPVEFATEESGFEAEYGSESSGWQEAFVPDEAGEAEETGFAVTDSMEGG